jgi:FdhE protein
MITATSALDRLKHDQPEWAPWLAVIEEILRETGDRRWDAVLPALTHSAPEAQGAGAAAPSSAAPRLAGTALLLPASTVRALMKRLIRTAASGGTPRMRSLEGALTPHLDVLTLFAASLCHDTARIKEIADACGVDAEALQAVAALVPIPFLQACNRGWASSIPASWIEGYCPICASWPAFAEVRGIERDRYFRCGRCGGAWHARPLSCPFCAMNDHNQLTALVPGRHDAHATIDACNGCLGYVKTFARLQGCRSDRVIVEDLASVALDVAALEQGYTRRPDAGYPLAVTVTDSGARRRLFSWNA